MPDETKQLTLAESAALERQQPTSLYAVFADMARDPRIEPSRIAQLMELQERAEKRNAEKEFIEAMNRLQPRLPRVTKKGKIEFTSKGVTQSTPFARFEDVDAAVRPLLTQEGFSIAFGTAPYDKGGLLITATLSHKAGHSRTESMPLPFDTSGSKNSIQAVGSTLSYGKRYLICAMLNIVTEGLDNDAASIGFVTEQQLNSLHDMVQEISLTPERVTKFLETMAAKSFAEIPRAAFPAAMNLLGAMRRKGS